MTPQCTRRIPAQIPQHKQSLALEALDSGQNHQEAADIAGVARDNRESLGNKTPGIRCGVEPRGSWTGRESQRGSGEPCQSRQSKPLRGQSRMGYARVALQWLRQYGSSSGVAGSLPTTPEEVIELRRMSLRPEDDALAILEEVQGLSRDRAIDAIFSDLPDGEEVIAGCDRLSCE